MGMVVASGLLGLLRLRILYGQFTPEETDIFFAAFRIPNLLFEILAMGALTSAFIPVYTRYISKGDGEGAHTLSAILINCTLAVVMAVSVPVFLFTEEISKLFTPGFSDAQIVQMAVYTRSMIILQVLPLLIGNFFTGILQSMRLFFIPALAPVLYNIGMIIGILLFARDYGLYSAVMGVGIGAFLFMIIQLPLVLSVGFRPRWNFNIHNPGVKEVFRLVLPRMIGLGATQIDVTVDLILSTIIGPKMVTVFTLAQSLQQLPVRLFGNTISQASFPTLSRASALEEMEKFKQSVSSAIRMVLFLVIPTSAFFIVLRIPIIRIVFGASLFDWESTVLTSLTLSAFSISLFAQAISQILTRGFYALYDSRTPVLISIGTIILNSIVSMYFVLILHLPIWSLGLSTSIAGIVNMVVLYVIMYKRIGGFDEYDTYIQPIKVCLAACVSALVVYIPMKLLDQLVFDTSRVFGLVVLTFLSGSLGVVTYLFLSWVLNIAEVYYLGRIFGQIKRLRTLFIEPAAEITGGEITSS